MTLLQFGSDLSFKMPQRERRQGCHTENDEHRLSISVSFSLDAVPPQ